MALDRISNLPSDVVENILSRLSIKEAVSTSVLSSNWRYKTAMLPHLVFDNRCFSNKNLTTFENIVNQVLLLHIGPINTFKLSHLDRLPTSDIDRWILHLSRNAIKELILHIWKGDPYKVPSCLFSCQDLVHLELYNCLLKPPSTFKGFKSLKSLDIRLITLAPDVFDKMIVCSPLLEKLTVAYIDGLTRLKIGAPNLQYLKVNGDFENVSLENTLNLVEVSIALDGSYDQRLVPGNCSNLYLAFGDLPEKLPEPLLSLNYLSVVIRFKHLKELLTALFLIRNSPSLKVLSISAEEDQAVLVEEAKYLLDDNENCLLTQLQIVTIIGVSGVETELDFIRFLLSNAPVLKRMTVKPASVNGELVKKLLQFRRASAFAEIIYMDP
ncbi:F-box/FBD/LRR-repeat protein At1g13570-like [Pyrus x bretschneideri]|uniref:F-box/FBD/LRR-repeat protein At1g13570-like n=1 Tax=Pyrus x bretschneideri TaxID=225117 RepID=UPI00202F6A36|nr:F-box/FBD/LRR-repeat protein At1g13570-like [Pyrus x bretschneideri]XP_048431033.1 F-box/FBD/LRR-repeat protein At1g13570-like [Pyrus x bretschneideri]